jgi:hypothetical protein
MSDGPETSLMPAGANLSNQGELGEARNDLAQSPAISHVWRSAIDIY